MPSIFNDGNNYKFIFKFLYRNLEWNLCSFECYLAKFNEKQAIPINKEKNK